MKYIAVFDVPDNAKPDQYSRPRMTFKLPHDYYKVVESDLQPMPRRCPEAFENPEAEGWNRCIDAIEKLI